MDLLDVILLCWRRASETPNGMRLVPLPAVQALEAAGLLAFSEERSQTTLTPAGVSRIEALQARGLDGQRSDLHLASAARRAAIEYDRARMRMAELEIWSSAAFDYLEAINVAEANAAAEDQSEVAAHARESRAEILAACPVRG